LFVRAGFWEDMPGEGLLDIEKSNVKFNRKSLTWTFLSVGAPGEL